MTSSIEDLLRQAAEKKRLEEEMRLAREIQMSLLPPGPLAVPGMKVAAVCVPAREVAGTTTMCCRSTGAGSVS
jgi:serine phosphatase RsbU (regulator of sigma subunit)